jgi:hypothetical protein
MQLLHQFLAAQQAAAGEEAPNQHQRCHLVCRWCHPLPWPRTAVI